MQGTATEVLERFVRGLDAKGKADLDALIAPELNKAWLPTPGPQLDAYLSEADLLLYGGAAGGGKTDLLCGLPICEHERSLIFRRLATDLEGYWDRLTSLSKGNQKQDSNKKRLITKDGRLVECGHLDAPGSEKSWQGRAHDFIGFDEGAQLVAYRVKFVLGWLRSTSGRRCRAVIASNPPIGGEGMWLIEWFAPWVDPLFPNPARHGELRWAITVGNEEEIRTIWVPGPGKYTVLGGEWRSKEQDGEPYEALSRTFIPSKLDDNPYLRDTGYRAQINAMPEPLRSQLLHGDFLAGRKDDPWQVIPTEWVRAAKERWKKNEGRPRDPMLHMGVDVAQGGADTTCVAPLRGVRFDPLTELPGKDTPDPVPVVQLILGLRRDDAGITVDHGGGYGGGVSSHLRTHNDIATCPFVPGAGSGARSRDSKLGFKNRRAEAWWKFREALDPGNPDSEQIELPPDTVLEAQLTAPRWTPKGDKVLVESKDDIRKRLGASTNRADAVIMAWVDRMWSVMRVESKKRGQATTAPIADPLAEF